MRNHFARGQKEGGLAQVLLHWNPAARPTPRQALRHSFFTRDLSSHTPEDCHDDPTMPGWC
jgi:hypothetical protein